MYGDLGGEGDLGGKGDLGEMFLQMVVEHKNRAPSAFQVLASLGKSRPSWSANGEEQEDQNFHFNFYVFYTVPHNNVDKKQCKSV